MMDGDSADEFTRRSPYTEITNKAEAIEGVLRRMLRAINDPKKGVDHEATRQVARLVKLLRLCTEHDIQKVHTELFEGAKFDETDKPKVREILVDALALAGTKNTIEHLIKKIKARDVTPARAAHALKALVNIRVPSEKQIDSLLELCKDVTAEKSGSLKQSCLLTAGSMINALCKDNKDKLAIQDEEDDGRYTQEKICSRQTKQKYVEKLWAFFEKAESRYERVLALKALANAGLDVSIFKLEDLIRDFNEDKLVRAEAIDALRQLRSVMPKKIQKVLMPVFANRRELPSLRMLAFAQIMQTKPIERALLDQMAQFIYRERSQHVHAFVHSMMTTMANSTIPCEKQTAEDLQTSLRMARAPMPSQSAMRSLYWHMPMFNQEQKLGATIRLGALLTNTSYLPVELMAGLDTLFMGDWVKNTLQVGIVQRDIESVVERSLRSMLQRGLDELVVRGKRSSGTGFRPAEMLRDLFTKLGIQSRRGEGEQSKPFAMLYIRYKDMDYAVLPFDESTMPEVIKQIYTEGKLDISAVERVLAHGHQLTTHAASFVYESMKKFPTSMGIPLQVSNKMPLVASWKSHVTAELEPSNGRTIRGLRAKVIAQASMAATHVSKMELWWPLVNSGVKLIASAQINLPMNVEAQISTERAETLRLATKTPDQQQRLLSLHTRPSTFIRVWPKQARAYVDVQEKTIHHEQQNRISSIEHTYGKELLGGAELEVHCQWHRTPSQPLKGMPNSLLAGENLVEIFTKPHGESKEVVIVMGGELFARPDEQTHKPNHGKFYDSQEDYSYERMDNSRERDEDESTNKKSKKERKEGFEKYTKEYSTDKAYKHRVHMALETSSKQKHAELELVAVCDPQMRFCKLEATAKRPAMLNGESRPWTLRAKGQTLYPQLPNSLENLKQQEHREFNAELEAEWGSDQKYIVNMRVQGEQSRRARQLLEEMTNRRDQSSQEERFNKNNKYDKYELLEKAAYLDQYKLETEYTTPMSPVVANVTYKLYNLLKAYQWQNSDIKFLAGEYKQQQSGGKRRLSAIWTIDPESRQYLNLTISSPMERVSFVDIALPMPFVPLVNIGRGSSSVHSFSQLIKRGQSGMSGSCNVDGKRVETFDDVEYKAKMTNCYAVLAKDCSDESQGSFAVLMKKTEKSGEEKTIKIVSQQKEVEIEMKKGEQKMKVKINGEHIREESRLSEEFGIEKHEDGYKIDIEEAGIKVFFDGYWAQIKASGMHLATQCGLCGNYNGDRDDEWRMPSNTVTGDFDEFRRSYDYDQCAEYKQKGSYNKYNDEDSSEEQRDNKKGNKQQRRRGDDNTDSEEPIKATAVMDQDGEICFSKQPIHICRDSSSMKESKKQTVPFVCEPRSRSVIQKAREARRGVVEVSGSPSFSDSVRVAVKCEQSDYDSYGRDHYEY